MLSNWLLITSVTPRHCWLSQRSSGNLLYYKVFKIVTHSWLRGIAKETTELSAPNGTSIPQPFLLRFTDSCGLGWVNELKTWEHWKGIRKESFSDILVQLHIGTRNSFDSMDSICWNSSCTESQDRSGAIGNWWFLEMGELVYFKSVLLGKLTTLQWSPNWTWWF